MTKPKSTTTGPKPKPAKGVTTRAKELMIEHGLTTSVETICELLTKEGYKPSRGSIGTLSGDFRQSVKVLNAMGRLKNLKVEPPKPKAEKAEKKPKPKTTKRPKKAAKAADCEPTPELQAAA